MLATKRSGDVAPEVNLRDPLRAGDKTYKPGDPKKGLSSPIKSIDVIFKKVEYFVLFLGYCQFKNKDFQNFLILANTAKIHAVHEKLAGSKIALRDRN